MTLASENSKTFVYLSFVRGKIKGAFTRVAIFDIKSNLLVFYTSMINEK